MLAESLRTKSGCQLMQEVASHRCSLHKPQSLSTHSFAGRTSCQLTKYTQRGKQTQDKILSLMTHSSKQGTHTSKLESLLFSHPNLNIWSQSSPHNPKHTTWQMYLVTSSSPYKGTTQRIFHLLSEGCSKLMSKGYSTQPKHVRTHVRTQSYHYI